MMYLYQACGAASFFHGSDPAPAPKKCPAPGSAPALF